MAEVTTIDVVDKSFATERPPHLRLVQTLTLRASAATTTSYVATDHAYVAVAERLNVNFNYDWDDGTSISWYYEWSPDGTNWYRAQNIATTAGASTITDAENTKTIGADGKWSDALYVVDAYFRVTVKRTGGSGTNALAISISLLGL